MDNNLPELSDIHLPDSVSAFPPAYGWWVLLLAFAGAYLLYKIGKYLYQTSKKRYALKLLKKISQSNAIEASSAVSEILRRICNYKYKEARGIYGKEWVAFLNRHSSKPLNQKSADLLIYAPYMQGDGRQY